MRIVTFLIVAPCAILCGCTQAARKHGADAVWPNADLLVIKEDFAKVQIGMARKKVLSMLGPGYMLLKQPRPSTFPGSYDDPKDPNLTFILAESYYPGPPLKRITGNSIYMWQSFIIYYDTADRVVHKSKHPDL